MLATIRKRIEEINSEIRSINDAASAESRTTLTEDEETRYAALSDERTKAEARIAQLEAEETRRAKDGDAAKRTGAILDAKGQPVITLGAEPQTYGRGSGNSYFLDIARSQVSNDTEALGRLNRHAQELDVELPAREARRTAKAERELRGVDRGSFFEKRTNPNRSDGTGGYFVPPLWLVDEYVAQLRNGRPFANAIRNIDLPTGTDSINIPTVASGTTTATQQDGGSVSSTDLTDSYVTAPVRTIAGQQDIAIQLLDQSPIAFDEVVFTDLIADYNYQLDKGLWQGAGTSGTLKGVDSLTPASGNAVTYTDASPTVPELYLPLTQLLSNVAQNRKRLDGISFWMHPRRWFWILSALDSSNRPLVTPYAPQGQNPAGIGGPGAEGPVGNIVGVDVYLDQSITTTKNSNQDPVYAIRTQDLFLFEGAMRTRALTEVLSGTLQVRLQVYNYAAALPDRYLSAIGWITGTGVAAPSGF